MEIFFKNIYASLKKNITYPLILSGILGLPSCASLNQTILDDIYYFPNENIVQNEIQSSDSSNFKEIKINNLEVKTLEDLNFLTANGIDATDYWRYRFQYSPYKSSLGWDFDGDGIINIFDLHPYSYDFYFDSNLNGIPDEIEWGLWPLNLGNPFYLNFRNYQWNCHVINNYHNNSRHRIFPGTTISNEAKPQEPRTRKKLSKPRDVKRITKYQKPNTIKNPTRNRSTIRKSNIHPQRIEPKHRGNFSPSSRKAPNRPSKSSRNSTRSRKSINPIRK